MRITYNCHYIPRQHETDDYSHEYSLKYRSQQLFFSSSGYNLKYTNGILELLIL